MGDWAESEMDPYERELTMSKTPRTDAHIVTGQVCEDHRDKDGKWYTQIKFEMNKEWVIADQARTLELNLERTRALLREVVRQGWYQMLESDLAQRIRHELEKP